MGTSHLASPNLKALSSPPNLHLFLCSLCQSTGRITVPHHSSLNIQLLSHLPKPGSLHFLISFTLGPLLSTCLQSVFGPPPPISRTTYSQPLRGPAFSPPHPHHLFSAIPRYSPARVMVLQCEYNQVLLLQLFPTSSDVKRT